MLKWLDEYPEQGIEAFVDAACALGRGIGDGLSCVIGGGALFAFVIITSPIWLTGLLIKRLRA